MVQSALPADLKMRRFFVEPDFIFSDHVAIEGDDFHHIIGVCRMETGAHFEILTSERRVFFVELTKIEKKRADATILETRVLKPLPLPHLHLVLSLPRPQKLDAIVEKSVELGLHTLHLMTSDYSFFRKASDFSEHRFERLKKIEKSARQQTARGEPMLITAVKNLDQIFDEFKKSQAQGVFAYEGQNASAMAEHFASLQAPTEIWAFVGSEGGFSDQEVLRFKDQNLKPLTMGEQILRVETACVALISVIKYHFHAGF